MKYATCKRCETVIPRDDMLSVNVHFYQESDRKDIVRVRLCSNCYKAMQREFMAIEWKNELLPGRGAGHINGTSVHVPWKERNTQSDDSEAAMRRKGKRVDVTY